MALCPCAAMGSGCFYKARRTGIHQLVLSKRRDGRLMPTVNVLSSPCRVSRNVSRDSGGQGGSTGGESAPGVTRDVSRAFPSSSRLLIQAANWL